MSRVMERRLARRREMRDISVGPETVRGVVVGVDEVKGLSEESGVALSVTSTGGKVCWEVEERDAEDPGRGPGVRRLRCRIKVPVRPAIGPEIMRTGVPGGIGSVERVALQVSRVVQRWMKSDI